MFISDYALCIFGAAWGGEGEGGGVNSFCALNDRKLVFGKALHLHMCSMQQGYIAKAGVMLMFLMRDHFNRPKICKVLIIRRVYILLTTIV